MHPKQTIPYISKKSEVHPLTKEGNTFTWSHGIVTNTLQYKKSAATQAQHPLSKKVSQRSVFT